jgi:bisphosphoglycerate-dependent phosphoglycerate mutase
MSSENLPPVITDREKYRCIRRELALRERNYPRWIAQNKMSAAQARHETAVMRAILQDYEHREQPVLFNQGRKTNDGTTLA